MPLQSCVHAWLEPLAQRLSLAPDCASEVLLIAEEMVTNIQKYAGLTEEDEVAITLQRHGDLLSLEVRDQGRPFNPLDEAQRADLGTSTVSAEIGGLGVHLITQFSDHQSYRRDGETNVLRIEKHLDDRSRD